MTRTNVGYRSTEAYDNMAGNHFPPPTPMSATIPNDTLSHLTTVEQIFMK